jgi:hypothetical protein
VNEEPKGYKPGSRRRKRVEIDGNPYYHIMKYNMTKLRHEIIMFLYEMRIATVDQIGRKFKQYSLDWIRRNLLDLYENGFIFRKFMHINRGSSGGIYYLDNIGAFYIAADKGVEKNDIKWSARDNVIGVDKSSHTISITEIRVILEETDKPDGFEILKFVGERHVGRIKFISQGESMEFNPDGEVIISDGEYQSFFFLEYDTGTESIGKLEDKIEKYEKFYRSEEIKKLYPVDPEVLVICENELSEHRFKKAIKGTKAIKELKFYISTVKKFKDDPFGGCFIDTDTDERISILD